MNRFDSEAAITGAKVITEEGAEVTSLALMVLDDRNRLVGVYNERVHQWYTNGTCVHGNDELQLRIAPEMGKGYLYILEDGCSVLLEKEGNYTPESGLWSRPIMMFDLSKYPIGFGLKID